MRASPATPIPAATILLVRDGESGIEVFMVERHHAIDFAGGALVFPGGKTDRSDRAVEIADLAEGVENFSPALRPLAITALREAFEESGVLFARDADSHAFVGASRCASLDPYRERIERGEIGFAAFLRQENLRLACGPVVHFAHWITPKAMPKRFDTHFFLAPVPDGQEAQHCGRESVASVWIGANEAAEGPGHLMFPTRMNLTKLAQSKSVEAALATARAVPPVTVEPWTEDTLDGIYVRIPEDAGYAKTRIPLRETLP